MCDFYMCKVLFFQFGISELPWCYTIRFLSSVIPVRNLRIGIDLFVSQPKGGNCRAVVRRVFETVQCVMVGERILCDRNEKENIEKAGGGKSTKRNFVRLIDQAVGHDGVHRVKWVF